MSNRTPYSSLGEDSAGVKSVVQKPYNTMSSITLLAADVYDGRGITNEDSVGDIEDLQSNTKAFLIDDGADELWIWADVTATGVPFWLSVDTYEGGDEALLAIFATTGGYPYRIPFDFTAENPNYGAANRFYITGAADVTGTLHIMAVRRVV